MLCRLGTVFSWNHCHPLMAAEIPVQCDRAVKAHQTFNTDWKMAGLCSPGNSCVFPLQRVNLLTQPLLEQHGSPDVGTCTAATPVTPAIPSSSAFCSPGQLDVLQRGVDALYRNLSSPVNPRCITSREVHKCFTSDRPMDFSEIAQLTGIPAHDIVDPLTASIISGD